MAQRRSAAEWRAVLGRQKRRGADDHGFAEELGVSIQTLRWWRWRLKKLEPEKSGESVFVRVRTVDDEEASRQHESFEVRFPGGLSVVVRFGFDANELARLVRTLETAC